MAENKNTKLQIRNSTVDFLIFTKDAHGDGIEVRVQDHDVWLTQKAIGQLFDVDRSVVTKHLKNIHESGELSEDSTCANFAQVADNGKTYQYKFYALSAIIAVGYRANSGRATQFRQWATKVLDSFAKQGYVLDKNRLINGQIFDEDYFDHLIVPHILAGITSSITAFLELHEKAAPSPHKTHRNSSSSYTRSLVISAAFMFSAMGCMEPPS